MFMSFHKMLLFYLLIQTTAVDSVSEDLAARLQEGSERDRLGWLLTDIVEREWRDVNCMVLLLDPHHFRTLQPVFFDSLLRFIPTFIVRVKIEESEDLLAPNYWTVKTIQKVRAEGCNFYIILLANGNQAFRFLRFGDKYRLIDTRARFVLKYSRRLFESTAQFLWNKIVNVVFFRRLSDSRYFELSTVPFPPQSYEVFLTNRINTWRFGHFQKGSTLFPEKTNNLKGHPINVVTFQHMPSTLRIETKNKDEDYDFYNVEITYSGLEIEILKSMSQAMNFHPILYEAPGGEEWGKRQLNGSYTGLLGEVMTGRAQIALGNVQHTLYNLDLIDLSRPYMSQCLTFLTPASRTDNSWKTLLLPFLLNTWIAILITLFFGGFMFFGFAQFHRHIENKHSTIPHKSSSKKQTCLKKITLFFRKRVQRGRQPEDDKSDSVQIITPLRNNYTGAESRAKGLFVFLELNNSILYTYGMLVSISLPKVPTGWALRIMTGWWWFYCLLMVVSYRASLTALLAKPEPKVTIDTIPGLVSSPLQCGGWGEPERMFFTSSFDPDIHKIGVKFETVADTDAAVDRVSAGVFAYYENQYFLLDAIIRQWQRRQNRTADVKRNLHIMSDCIISMPISIGLEKNSPLKPRIDEFIQRIVEAGLVHKWLDDVMAETRRRHDSYQTEQVKALMDMSKFSGALVALGIGYAVSLATFLGEIVYWRCIVQKDPLFDKYSMSQFYFCKKNK